MRPMWAHRGAKLCLSMVKLEETLLKARNNSNMQINHQRTSGSW